MHCKSYKKYGMHRYWWRMLEAKCIDDYFWMLVTDWIHKKSSTWWKIANIFILSPTSEICEHHKITNITVVKIWLLLYSLSNNLYRMAVIGFIFFVRVLSNFYQAVYDDIIYDDFANGWGKLSYVLVDSRDGRTRISAAVFVSVYLWSIVTQCTLLTLSLILL